jgi:hypothetical protein
VTGPSGSEDRRTAERLPVSAAIFAGLTDIGVPVPLAPWLLTKYSAPSTVPPSSESSPVVVTAMSLDPLPAAGFSTPAVVTGPELLTVSTIELTAPQFPAESSART